MPCMVFGICNPAVVTEDTASTISEKDWLRCYSHIVRKYMLTGTGCYLSTAGMLMMLGHHDVNVANQSDLGPHQEDDHQPACLQDHRSTKRSKRS